MKTTTRRRIVLYGHAVLLRHVPTDKVKCVCLYVSMCACVCAYACDLPSYTNDHNMGEVANMDLSDLGKKCDFCNVSQINYTCFVGLFITFTTSKWLKHVLLVDTHPRSGLFIRSSTTHYTGAGLTPELQCAITVAWVATDSRNYSCILSYMLSVCYILSSTDVVLSDEHFIIISQTGIWCWVHGEEQTYVLHHILHHTHVCYLW